MAENKFFSKNVKYLRKSRALTLAELAAKLGYGSHATVQKWESGATTPPTEAIERLCELYHVTADQLLRTDIQKTDVARAAAGIANDWEIGRTIILGSSDVNEALSNLDDPHHEHAHPKSKEQMDAERRYESEGAKDALRFPTLTDASEAHKLKGMNTINPMARIGALMGQAAKDPAIVKAVEVLMRMAPEDRQLAVGMLDGLAANHSE